MLLVCPVSLARSLACWLAGLLARRKVVGGSLVPSETPVMSVMTPDPLWVNQSDSAMEALGTMIEKHFRHLPVSATGHGENGSSGEMGRHEIGWEKCA